MTATDTAATTEAGRDFIRDIIQADLEAGRVTDGGHPLSAGTERLSAYRPRQGDLPELRRGARNFGGRCHLRFDDTNPTKEEQEFIDAIKRDVHWLGFDWGEHLLSRVGLFRAALRMGRASDPRGQGLCRRHAARSRCAASAAR